MTHTHFTICHDGIQGQFYFVAVLCWGNVATMPKYFLCFFRRILCGGTISDGGSHWAGPSSGISPFTSGWGHLMSVVWLQGVLFWVLVFFYELFSGGARLHPAVQPPPSKAPQKLELACGFEEGVAACRMQVCCQRIQKECGWPPWTGRGGIHGTDPPPQLARAVQIC